MLSEESCSTLAGWVISEAAMPMPCGSGPKRMLTPSSRISSYTAAMPTASSERLSRVITSMV